MTLREKEFEYGQLVREWSTKTVYERAAMSEVLARVASSHEDTMIYMATFDEFDVEVTAIRDHVAVVRSLAHKVLFDREQVAS